MSITSIDSSKETGQRKRYLIHRTFLTHFSADFFKTAKSRVLLSRNAGFWRSGKVKGHHGKPSSDSLRQTTNLSKRPFSARCTAKPSRSWDKPPLEHKYQSKSVLFANQNRYKRSDIREVHLTVFVAIGLFDIHARYQNIYKRRDIRKVDGPV